MTLNVEWLSSPQAQHIINVAENVSLEANDIQKFRTEFPDVDIDLIGSAIHQAWLRKRAFSRWRVPTTFLMTTDGLSQATRPVVANWHAQWITENIGPNSHVLDLTCGLGFDVAAIARAGHRVTAIELDPEIAALATHNLEPFNVDVICSDATNFEIPSDVDVIFVDPARRDPKAAKTATGDTIRNFSSKNWSPSWDFVRELAKTHRVIAKVAPGVDDDTIGKWNATFVSVNGDLVEALLTSPIQKSVGESTRTKDADNSARDLNTTYASHLDRAASVHQPKRTALLFDQASGECVELASDSETTVAELGTYLLTPDASLIRARALSELADRCDAGLVNSHIAWLTTNNREAALDLAQQSPRMAQVFEILDVIPFSPKTLKRDVATYEASAITIMTRGVQVNVDELRKKISGTLTKSAPELVIAIYRDDSGNKSILARRV